MTLGVLAAAAASSAASNDVEPGVLAFLIVAAMGVALVFLLRSMNKQFRKITPEPDAADGPTRRRRLRSRRRSNRPGIFAAPVITSRPGPPRCYGKCRLAAYLMANVAPAHVSAGPGRRSDVQLVL